jgi:hypothetical protein
MTYSAHPTFIPIMTNKVTYRADLFKCPLYGVHIIK